MTLHADVRSHANKPRGLTVPVVVSAAVLTLLFTAQSVMRRPNGVPVDVLNVLGVNALDWGSWALFVPVIVAAGRRWRLDADGNRVARIAVWVALSLVCTTAQSLITGVVLRVTGMARVGGPPGAPPPPFGRYLWNWVIGGAGFNMIIFLMIAGAFHAVLYYRDLTARQLRQVDLEARLAHAELSLLRMQLQPHFFFNALHTISSLMVSDVATAHRVVASLGDLLRASFDHTARQEITLQQELTFVDRYLDIQKARFRKRLEVEIDVDDSLLIALVPSLVLQPLVENAIRHGIETRAKGGTIRIRGERRGDQIVLTVRDDGEAPPADAESSLRPPTSGVGLKNIAGRLAQLYGDAQEFRARRESDGQFEVMLAFPFHTDPALFPAASNGR